MLPLSKIYPVLSFAVRKGLLDDLNEVYERVPQSSCERCGTCCVVPPPAFTVEYLNVFKYLADNLKDKIEEITEKAIRFYFLELVKPGLKCPFLDDSNYCMIYPARPFYCRVFGVTQKKDYDLNARKERMKELVKKYRERYGIELPREIVEFQLPFCQKSRPAKESDRLSREEIQLLAAEIGRMEAEILPLKVVEGHYTLMPVATHLVLTLVSEGARLRRVEVMREYLERGCSEVLDKYVQKFRLNEV